MAEIEDRGLGLSADELAGINQRLANPPEFDLANSEQLGLFIVSRLAARHGIKVALRESVYGGTTAIIVVPFGVIVREEDAIRSGHSDWQAGEQRPRGSQHCRPPRELRRAGPRRGRVNRPARVPCRAWSRPAGIACRGADWPAGRAEALPDAHQGRLPALGTGPQPTAGYGQPEPGVQPPAPVHVPPWDLANTTPWPNAWHRGAANGTARPGEPGGHDGDPGGVPENNVPENIVLAGGAGPATSGSHLGMPIRVPQASLVPQLRARRDTEAQAAAREAADVDQRSPEATRSMMIMMQQGWQRGRVDDLDDPQGAPDDRD